MSTSLAISTAALSVALANQSGGVMIPVDSSAEHAVGLMLVWFARIGLPALLIGSIGTFLWYCFNPGKLHFWQTAFDKVVTFWLVWTAFTVVYLITTMCVAAWI